MISYIKKFILLFILSFNIGCATLFSSKNHSLKIEGTPPKAQIHINGIYMGETPLELEIPKKSFGRDTKIEIKAKGYRPLTVTIEKTVNVKFILLDALTLGTALFVDFATGAIYDSQDETIRYLLEKETK